MSHLGVKIMSVFLMRRIFLSLSFLFFTSICFASDESVEKGIKDKLLVISPEMPIDLVSATEMPWLFQVSLKDGTILYADKNGHFLFAGQVFDMREGRFNNLTEKSKKENRTDLLSLSPENEMIIFPSKTSKPLATITVFTDID